MTALSCCDLGRKAVLTAFLSFFIVSGCNAENVTEANRCYLTAATADSWLVSLQDRVRENDGIFAYMQKLHGAPQGCEGKLGDGFDGQQFGQFSFRWTDGVVFSVEVLPPETSIRKVDFAQTGPAEDTLVDSLKKVLVAEGLEMDWAKPASEVAASGSIKTYSSTVPGMNAFLRVIYDKEGKVSGIETSIAP